MEPGIAEAVARAREEIAAACARAGRDPSAVTLLAASKTVRPERIHEAYAAGMRHFGENRVQEREDKKDALADLEIEWHLIGGLQRNKAARAIACFDVIEAVDSLELARRLNGLAAQPLRVMIEINLAVEGQKHGVAPALAPELARRVGELRQLRLEGVMAVPPAAENPEDSRPYFRELTALAGRIRRELPAAPERWEISMGMSHDYAVAVEEGATVVRLGTALFGARI
ncbi:MAG: YggS family pyridoxal phosphate-dependent enzyme [Terriglobales bacterium]